MKNHNKYVLQVYILQTFITLSACASQYVNSCWLLKVAFCVLPEQLSLYTIIYFVNFYDEQDYL